MWKFRSFQEEKDNFFLLPLPAWLASCTAQKELLCQTTEALTLKSMVIYTSITEVLPSVWPVVQPASLEMHIKTSLLGAFCAAIVIIYQQADPQQKQHYINKENYMKHNQQGATLQL